MTSIDDARLDALRADTMRLRAMVSRLRSHFALRRMAAVAFFHTHPNRPETGFRSGPSVGDQSFAAGVGLPGLIQSHDGMYYFGPTLRRRGSR